MKTSIILFLSIFLFGCENPEYEKTVKKCKIINQYSYQDWSLAIHPETKWKIVTECGDTITTSGRTYQDSVTFIYLKRK